MEREWVEVQSDVSHALGRRLVDAAGCEEVGEEGSFLPAAPPSAGANPGGSREGEQEGAKEGEGRREEEGEIEQGAERYGRKVREDRKQRRSFLPLPPIEAYTSDYMSGVTMDDGDLAADVDARGGAWTWRVIDEEEDEEEDGRGGGEGGVGGGQFRGETMGEDVSGMGGMSGVSDLAAAEESVRMRRVCEKLTRHSWSAAYEAMALVFVEYADDVAWRVRAVSKRLAAAGIHKDHVEEGRDKKEKEEEVEASGHGGRETERKGEEMEGLRRHLQSTFQEAASRTASSRVEGEAVGAEPSRCVEGGGMGEREEEEGTVLGKRGRGWDEGCAWGWEGGLERKGGEGYDGGGREK